MSRIKTREIVATTAGELHGKLEKICAEEREKGWRFTCLNKGLFPAGSYEATFYREEECVKVG